MDSMWYYVFGIIFFMIVGTTWFLLDLRSYNYKLRIRELTSGKVRLIKDIRAKIKKDKDKIEYLGLYGKFNHLKGFPLPPENVIDYDPHKKKKVIECYYSADKGIVYITDENEVNGFEPFTTKQRAMMVNQLFKKEARKIRKWTDNIPMIVGGITLVLILTVLLIFWGEAIKPMVEFSDKLNGMIDKLDNIIQHLDVLVNGNRTQIVINNVPP